MTDPTPFFDLLIGKPATHIWRGGGSALFIEFGKLTPGARNSEISKGEVTLMIEWSWRIEAKASILGGSWSSEKKWPVLFNKLIGATVTNAQTFGLLPEILITFSNGLKVVSFMTADGQPQWALLTRTPNIGSLFVKRGKLTVEV